MSFVVRVAGPDFLAEENRNAFARVEESVRQFSAHSRETIDIIRNPLESLRQDHFVVLWRHGSALVTLLPYGGVIRGGLRNEWIMEQPKGGAVAETRFDSPVAMLQAGKTELLTLLQDTATAFEDAASREATRTSARQSQAVKTQSIVASDTSPVNDSHGLRMIALFTLPVRELALEPIGDPDFAAMSVEHATARTMFHMPNLLRVTDQQRIVNSSAELQLLSNILERSAEKRLTDREAEDTITDGAGGILRLRRAARTRRSKGFRYWWIVAALVVAAIVLLLVTRPRTPSKVATNTDSLAHVQKVRERSTLVIQLPSEIQLFVSPSVYKTRSDLDRALSHGEGVRFLPSKELTITLDSASLATGVYGYFKVDNEWRRGKLLQTFKATDTVMIDNFLQPLP